MKNTKLVWLASYPRSGNTLLRTILWQCFSLRSTSIYSNDLGGNRRLEEYVGHIEKGADRQFQFTENELLLVKTHEHAKDNNPAIYIIRDGRAACVSLWEFHNKSHPLEVVIDGRHMYGTWANHVKSWNPWERPNTLLLEYEDLLNNLPETLDRISKFLKRSIISGSVPDRNTIASIDGQWVRTKNNWRSELSGDLLKRFNQINKDILEKAGYLER
ncbi:sulfotransferase domain-containing protein [Pseudomonadota bacterium]